MLKSGTSAFAYAAAVLLTAGCMSQPAQRIDNALLAEVSSAEMATVQQARAARDAAADRLAKARRDTTWAENQVTLARAELKSARTELQGDKLALIFAERSGTVTELEAARREHEYATSVADATRDKLALRKRELEHVKLLEKLALERDRLAAAEVELVKARAVQELDRVEAQKIPIRDFEKQVKYHRTEVALAEVRAGAAADLVAEARTDFEQAEVRSASFRN